MPSIDDLLDGVSGVEIGAAATAVQTQSFDINNLLAGFPIIAAIAAGATGTATLLPKRAIRPKHFVVDPGAAIGSVGLSSFTVGAVEQLVGNGPVPAAALQRDQTFIIYGDTIQTSPGATIVIINSTAATALANLYNAVVGPAAVSK